MNGPGSTREVSGGLEPAARRRYRLVGFLTGSFGLAVAARNTLSALRFSGRSVEGVTVQAASSRGPEGPRPSTPCSPDEIALFHMNPMEIAGYSAGWRNHISRTSPAVCVPFWELPMLPDEWEPVLRGMDAVLAPTRFIQDACAKMLGPDRVLHYPQAVFPPAALPAREAWGMKNGRTVFLVSFDIGSDIDRKNPGAAIQAFRKAFPSDRDVELVIKTKPWAGVPAFQAQAAELRASVASDPRIRIIERSLPYDELLSLYASCDVLLALHRSEGLGLHLMEAMSLGRAVVATGWSGNMDFMTPDNSVDVRYSLVPARSRHSAYASELARPGQVWAEADVEHAAAELRALHLSPDRRRALGARAAGDMDGRRAQMLSGETFAHLETVLSPFTGYADELRRGVLRTRARIYWKALIGAPRAVARRVGLLRV
jgi:glycosyltransferase involved in cell wall biosynthesis